MLEDAASVAKVEAGLQHAGQYLLAESVVCRFFKLGAAQVRAAAEARFQTPSFQAFPFGLNCQAPCAVFAAGRCMQLCASRVHCEHTL